MVEKENDGKKNGGRRMDKAMLINLLTKANSLCKSPSRSPQNEDVSGKSHPDQHSVPTDPQGKQVSEAK
jgi:hypothetical protein